MCFSEKISLYNWKQIQSEIYSKTETDVEFILSKNNYNLSDFISLISPAALKYIEPMAKKSQAITQKRFGKTIQLYIPLYLSNYCENQCVYCGFNSTNPLKRVVLSNEQILQEIEVIKSFGYQHILLVTGESPTKAGIDYLTNVVNLIKPYFSLIALEVQPLEQNEYEQLINAGVTTVYIYQETYNKEAYKIFHINGKKTDYTYRLNTPDRLGKAGIKRIGIGSLIGLSDWRTDAFFTALHLKYLEKKYWKTKYSISFPRLRPHAGKFEPKHTMSDKELVQLICAYRLIDEEVELSLSTRESPKFRDNVLQLGITSMSAGSKTTPGGYAVCTQQLEQFEVHDNRSPQQISEAIKQFGYEPIWKDWDYFM